MNQTTELTFSFRVPGCGIASALAGLALAAQFEKLLAENGCVLQLGHICANLSEPVTGKTASAAPTTGDPAERALYVNPETPAPAEATPTPEPEKPKRTRTPKEAVKEPEAPAPKPEPEKQPEPPQAAATPAPDPADGVIHCERLVSIHRTGRSAAAAANMPQWNAVTEAITGAGYAGAAAIRAALADPKTAAQAAADVVAIRAECEKALTALEEAIAAKKAKAEDDLP